MAWGRLEFRAGGWHIGACNDVAAEMSEILFLPLHWLAEASLVALAAALFLLMLAVLELCYRLGRNAVHAAPANDGLKTATGIVTGGMLGLFAFLLGVMFSLAGDRYEKRRQSVLDEANAIGTVWLRAELVAPEGAAIRERLRDYMPLRLATVRGIDTDAETARVVAETERLQGEIWALVSAAALRTPTAVSVSLIGSVNEMFDLATTNRRNFRHGVPPYVLRLVIAVAVLSVGAMGYQFGIHGHRQLAVTMLLLATWTLALALVLDIDSAGQGSVRVSPDPMIWTMQSWGPR
jgi:hypothetical protein